MIGTQDVTQTILSVWSFGHPGNGSSDDSKCQLRRIVTCHCVGLADPLQSAPQLLTGAASALVIFASTTPQPQGPVIAG
jgi:hypothetical protein